MLQPAPPPFEPFPLLANGHLMTIATRWPRRRLAAFEAAARDRTFQVDDENRVIARCNRHADGARRPTALLVHGLAGDARSGYMVGTAEKAFRAGFDVVRLNVRGCGGTEHLAPGGYHAGMVDDPRHVLFELAERDGVERVHLVGFSLGGNMVVRLAGLLGDEAPAALRSVVSISGALELSPCADQVDGTRIGRIYRHYFLARLKDRARRMAELFPERYPLPDLDAIRTLREFDDAFTAPHGGFDGAADYYERASAWPLAARVRVPLLLVHAQDDPIVPPVYLERPEVRDAPGVRVLTTRHGGHCAWIGRRSAETRAGRDPDRYWVECRVVDALLALDRSPGAIG